MQNKGAFFWKRVDRLAYGCGLRRRKKEVVNGQSEGSYLPFDNLSESTVEHSVQK